ncbi:MAG: hypothetical protein ABJL54_19980 [Halioglobus sp.]
MSFKYFSRVWLIPFVLLPLATAVMSDDMLTMQCEQLPPLEGVFSPEDLAEQAAFCAIDLSADDVAICPKTWSTSPGAVIYAVTDTQWQGRTAEFERTACAPGGHARELATAQLAVFKNSLNGRETSGTFSPSPLLYYHFSRLLQTKLHVPVAVRVEFPLAAYRPNVIKSGLAFTESSRRKMLHAGWQEMHGAAVAPADYSHRRELFTADNQRLWGVLLLQSGKRYGPEVNGTRASGWGDGQNLDFQRTAAFLALRSELPLNEAIRYGVAEARKDEAMAAKLSAQVSPVQVARWMEEVTELVILDYLLKQQDRIGNIDYLWRWHWVEQGQLVTSATEPEGKSAVKLRMTALNDNDAGVRSGYANYAARTNMLQDWHHMNYDLYQSVQRLAEDFAASGPVATAVRNRYRLSSREAEGIIKRGVEIASQLRVKCKAGGLRFDLSLADSLQVASRAQSDTDDTSVANAEPIEACESSDAIAQAVSPNISTE